MLNIMNLNYLYIKIKVLYVLCIIYILDTFFTQDYERIFDHILYIEAFPLKA
jgi:hypothetical protein